MNEVLRSIEAYGLVPVIKIDNADNAIPLAAALREGGLPVAEITFRTKEGEKAISRISNDMPDILVGAGTILTCEQADRAKAAGARFIVSPGFNPSVVQHCLDIDLPITPGVSNPTDMEKAIEMGLEVVKFFPAEQSGGIAFIKAVSAPYPTLKFIPTGGISAKNLNDYLSFKKVIACGGSWMVKPELIAGEKFEEITRLTSEAVQTMLGFEFAHVGINCTDASEAMDTACILNTMFRFPPRDGRSSVFAGTEFECMKSPFLGQHGHIGIKTNYVSKAIEYLSGEE